MLVEAATFGQDEWRDDVGRGAGVQACDVVHHVHHLMFLDQLAADGGISLADAGVEELQELIDFRARAHGGARVVGVHLLFDGDGRGEAGDAFHVGLVEAAHKLPCIRAEAFHITALSFGIKRVERQRRLARAGKSRDDHEFVFRNA